MADVSPNNHSYIRLKLGPLQENLTLPHLWATGRQFLVLTYAGIRKLRNMSKNTKKRSVFVGILFYGHHVGIVVCLRNPCPLGSVALSYRLPRMEFRRSEYFRIPMMFPTLYIFASMAGVTNVDLHPPQNTRGVLKYYEHGQ